jgi:hypothetical protein
LKQERRRQQREHKAYLEIMNDNDVGSNQSEAEMWRQLAPLLDESVAQLGDADRAALVLRYYEQRPLDEVGAALGIGADAAQKRVTRALEKLRARFTKRGAGVSAALLASAISANSVQAAPVGLAKTISVVAATQGATATTSSLILAKETMRTMLWNKVKTAATISAFIVLAAGTMTLFAQHAEKPVAKIPYKMLEDAWLFQQSINPTNLTFHFLIGSSKKGVRAEDIHLTIKSASKGNIAVQLGGRGQLLDFPGDDDLRQENPFVVSDQPSGTLRMGYWVYVPRPEGLTFRYDHLANAVDEANKAAARANQTAKSEYDQSMAIFPGKINGVGLVFPASSAGKAKMIINVSAGAKEYVADAHGMIKLKINPALQTENPELIFSERPDWIGILQF